MLSRVIPIFQLPPFCISLIVTKQYLCYSLTAIFRKFSLHYRQIWRKKLIKRRGGGVLPFFALTPLFVTDTNRICSPKKQSTWSRNNNFCESLSYPFHLMFILWGKKQINYMKLPPCSAGLSRLYITRGLHIPGFMASSANTMHRHALIINNCIYIYVWSNVENFNIH